MTSAVAAGANSYRGKGCQEPRTESDVVWPECSWLIFVARASLGENLLKKSALLAVPQQDCVCVQEAFWGTCTPSVPGEPVREASRGVVLGRIASVLTR